MVCNNRLLFTVRAEGGKEEGVGVERTRYVAISLPQGSKISQPSWGHGAVLSFHGRRTKGKFFFKEFTGTFASFCHAALLFCTSVSVKDWTSMFILDFIPGCPFSL